MNLFRRLCRAAALVIALDSAFVASAASAADFEISLQVKSATQQTDAKFTEQQPSPTKPRPRPVFTAKAKETLVISWKATDTTKQTTFQDVLIHCFIVAEKNPGQADLPSMKDPEQESALTMDFKPADIANGEFSLKLDQPGTYLVRVETQNMLDRYGHEYYAALDLICK
jgi:hypothetical protein